MHSLILSALVYNSSNIWSSVSGYYASHYVMRAFAHAAGYFRSKRTGRLAQVKLDGGSYTITYKRGNDNGGAEHQLYWNIASEIGGLEGKPLFVANLETGDETDIGHRAVANYYDHVGGYRNVNQGMYENAVTILGGLPNQKLPARAIPRRSAYPEVLAVMRLAYHRIRRYREFMDDILGTTSAFWTTHREPEWTQGLLSFPEEHEDSPADVIGDRLDLQ